MKHVGSCSTTGLRTACNTALTFMAVLMYCAYPAWAEPPLGSRSFLTRHVRSINELRRELDRDPRLIRIYAQLLHMTPAQVKSEFSKLKLVKLREEGVYKVYGAFGSAESPGYSFKVRRLPKGTDTFTLEDGVTPVILKQCGNLLRGYYSTPGPIATTVPEFNEVNPDAGLPAAPGPSPESISLETPLSSEWGWIEDTAAAAPAPDYFPPSALVHSAARAWWPWLFPAIGVPFIGGGGGGARSGGAGSSPLASGPVSSPTLSPDTVVPTPFLPGPVVLPGGALPGPVVPSPLVPTGPGSLPVTVLQPAATIPEPGSLLMLAALGTSGMGLFLLSRRRAGPRGTRSR